jgi:uncharacterized DUF497 family protein
VIEFDVNKSDENLQKHGFPLDFAELLFDGPYIEEEDARLEYGETRFVATDHHLWQPHLCCGIHLARNRSPHHQFQESQ